MLKVGDVVKFSWRQKRQLCSYNKGALHSLLKQHGNHTAVVEADVSRPPAIERGGLWRIRWEDDHVESYYARSHHSMRGTPFDIFVVVKQENRD